MKKALLLFMCLSLFSCKISEGLVYESIKTLGKKGLEKVLNLSETQLQKDSIQLVGNYSNTLLVRRLGKGFTSALTNEGFITTKTRRFIASVSWQPNLNDTTFSTTRIEFYYYKSK